MYNDRDLLAKTLMAEAGNQGYLGMLAAGSVIMNRVKSGRYGQGLQGVIMKPGAFSPWNSVTGFAGGEQGQNMAAIRPSEEAYRVADELLSGKATDPTRGATHFYNPDISNPSWGVGGGGDWTKIGAHVFGRADDQNKGPSRVMNVSSQSSPAASVAADTMTALGKGGGPVTPDQIAQSAMAPSAGQEPERPRGLLGNLFGNPDTMANLALAFNSMRLNPDPNLAAVLSAQMKERRAERKEKAQRNATADALDKIAPGAGDLVRAGIFSGSEALKFAKDKEKMALAQQASEAMANGDYKTAYALSLRLSPTAAGQAIAQQLGPRQSEVIAGGKYTTTYVDGQPVVTPNQAVIDAERQLLEQEREAERIRKGLPTTAQKAEEADFDALGAIDMITAETARIERLFGRNKETGEFEGPLKFGVGGLISGGLGSIGFGEANEKVARAREDYETFKTRLVNESLRLNKGVQTEGDAQRAMNELGGAKTTAEAYAAIQKLQRINERARQLRERAIRTRRERYNLPDATIPQYAPTWEVVE